MAYVKLYNKTGDDKAKHIQEKIEKKFGFLPETFQAMGRTGDFLEAMMKLAESSGEGLDQKIIHLICVAVSAVNGCDYCVAAHRKLAMGAGATDEEVTAAIEVAAQISAFNIFNKSIGLNIDIK